MENNEIIIHLSDGSVIEADSQVLMQRCMFFRHLLDPRFVDESNREVYITDYDSCTVRQLIKYIIHNELDVTKKTDIAQLLALCDLMCLPLLYSMICQIFEDVLCDRNCFQILEFTLQRNYQTLTNQCWHYIFTKYPYMTRISKSRDWNYNTLKMTFTSEHIRFIEISSVIKYFKYWSVVHSKRYNLLKKVIQDILKQNTPIRRCILELLECLVTMYDANRCLRVCNRSQRLNLLIIGGYLGKDQDFYNDKFIPHNEFHVHTDLGYATSKSIPSMKIHRIYSTSALDRNGFYVIGGQNNYGDILDTIEYYDFDKNKWTKELFMEQPKMQCASVCVNDQLYVSGGRNVNKNVLKESFIFLSKKNIWKRIADMSQCREGHQMCSVHGTIYAVGGKGENGDTLKSVECYDIFTNKWVYTSSMIYSR